MAWCFSHDRYYSNEGRQGLDNESTGELCFKWPSKPEVFKKTNSTLESYSTFESLKSLSVSNNFTFTDNSIIDNSCLNSSKLHLNSKGSSLLAVKFINFVRSDSSRGPSSQARQGFRRPNVYNQLSKVLLELANARRRRSRDRRY